MLHSKQGQQDTWIWRNGHKDGYFVCSTYDWLSESRKVEAATYRTIWNKHVTLKVAAFVLRALQNRIPAKENLLRSGVKL